MRRFGLISGPQAEVMPTYWRELHAEVRHRIGRSHTARLIIENLDGCGFGDLTMVTNRRRASEQVRAAARRLVAHGAEAILLCSSPLHLVVNDVAMRMGVPLLHMVNAVAAKLTLMHLVPVAVLGAIGKDEEKMWHEGFAADGVLRMILPPPSEAEFIAGLLRRGIEAGAMSPTVRARMVRLSAELKQAGAVMIVFTTPELALVLPDGDSVIPTMCAVQTHCEYAVAHALGDLELHPAGNLNRGHER